MVNVPPARLLNNEDGSDLAIKASTRKTMRAKIAGLAIYYFRKHHKPIGKRLQYPVYLSELDPDEEWANDDWKREINIIQKCLPNSDRFLDRLVAVLSEEQAEDE